MKKIFGLKIGGLQQKILNLVLIFLIVTIAFGAALSTYKAKQLGRVVGTARDKQQQAIENVSNDTMHQVLESTMIKTNAMQAYIADNMFESVRKDVFTLQTLAEDIFQKSNVLEPREVYLPDPANDGKVTAQVLFEEGVDYTQSKYLPIAAHLTGTMEAMYTSSTYTSNIYIGFEDGTHIAVDKMSSDKFDESGKLISFPVRQRPWYKGAVEADGITFSGVMEDTYSGSICVTCSAPVHVDGKLIGVVGIDLFLDTVADYVEQSSGNGGFVCIVNKDGKLIFAPQDNGIFEVVTTDEAPDLRNSDNKELAGFITTSLTASTGLDVLNVNGKDYYMTGTPMNAVGWSLISVVEKDITELPAKQMIEEYERINSESSQAYTAGSNMLKQQTFIVLSLILLLGSGCALFTAGRIVKPIESMTSEIIEGGKTGKLFEMKDIYRTNDEIEVLAESFDDLSKKTKQYIEDITRITKEKERIGTELELARKIQADMLPNIYPAFPDRPEFDIYATMTPAKEVGGDFYDFFLIDDDHLGMVMADVSGKGVPAALFMMMSKIIINNYAVQDGSPARVLEHANSIICKNNEEEMFVTVWLGVLEISTGKITAANAGHEYPIVRKADGTYELFKDKHGFVVGGMDGMRYKEYEIQLEKGGALFLYTDGVPEATNSENILFGTDRLIEALNRNKNSDPKQMLTNTKIAVDEFVGEAEQFDDLTMLALTWI